MSSFGESTSLRPPVGPQDHARGPEDAPITLVEYGDYQCPACGQAYPVLRALQRAMGDQLRFVFRNFPLREMHPYAEQAAEAAEAAAAQHHFWAMHDALFEHQDALDERDILGYATDAGIDPERVADALERGTFVDRVERDVESGLESGVQGTPSFFVNGEPFTGNWTDPRAFEAALRSAVG